MQSIAIWLSVIIKIGSFLGAPFICCNAWYIANNSAWLLSAALVCIESFVSFTPLGIISRISIPRPASFVQLLKLASVQICIDTPVFLV